MIKNATFLKMLIAGTVVIIFCFALYVFLNRGVKVVIHNSDPNTLYDVSVRLTGKTYLLGDISPGEDKSIVVKPVSESHIEIEHGKSHRRKMKIDCYIEPGYKGRIKIELDADKVLKVEDKTGI